MGDSTLLTDSALAETDVDVFAEVPKVGAPLAHRRLLGVHTRVWLWLAGFLAALLVCWQWGTGAGGAGVHNDFTQNVWLPSRLVLDGHNPYYPTQEQVYAALGEYRDSFDRPNPVSNFNSGATYHSIYPVWVAMALSPFAALPLPVATTLWRALNVLLLVWSVVTLLRTSNPAFRSPRPQVVIAIAVIVLLCLLPTFRESYLTLLLGQFAIIELGLLAAIWAWLMASGRSEFGEAEEPARRRWWGDALVGLALAALATKPQSVGLAVVLVGLWALSRRRFVIPAVAVGSLAALLLVPNLLYAWSLGDWLAVVRGGQAGSQVEVSASVWGVSYQWLGPNAPWMAVALVLTAVGMAALMPRWWSDLRDRVSPVPLTLGVTLCVNSVVSPYLLGYEQVVLLLPALVLLAAFGLPGGNARRRQERDGTLWRLAIYAWLAVLPTLVFATQAALGLEYPAIMQSLAMLALCWVAKPEWKWDQT